MSNNPPNPSIEQLQQSQMNVMDMLNNIRQMDKVMALSVLLDIKDIEITIAGEKQKILNQELITEYTNHKMTQFMVRNETWRASVKEVFHLKDINEEKIVGTMDTQVILKMRSHKRKGVTEYINGLKNDVATGELIPQNTKKKRFFGMM